ASSILFRYFFSTALNFVTPLSIYLMIWISFLGSGLAIRKSEHIFVDLFINRFTGRTKVRMLVLINTIISLFLLSMMYFGFQFALTGLNSSDTFLFDISMFIPYLSVPVGMLYMQIVIILKTIIMIKTDSNENISSVPY